MSEISDNNRFRYFAPEQLATFPEGFVGAPLEFKTTTELMAERKAWRDSTVVCECCGGEGRVLARTQVGAA